MSDEEPKEMEKKEQQKRDKKSAEIYEKEFEDLGDKKKIVFDPCHPCSLSDLNCNECTFFLNYRGSGNEKYIDELNKANNPKVLEQIDKMLGDKKPSTIHTNEELKNVLEEAMSKKSVPYISLKQTDSKQSKYKNLGIIKAKDGQIVEYIPSQFIHDYAKIYNLFNICGILFPEDKKLIEPIDIGHNDILNPLLNEPREGLEYCYKWCAFFENLCKEALGLQDGCKKECRDELIELIKKFDKTEKKEWEINYENDVKRFNKEIADLEKETEKKEWIDELYKTAQYWKKKYEDSGDEKSGSICSPHRGALNGVRQPDSKPPKPSFICNKCGKGVFFKDDYKFKGSYSCAECNIEPREDEPNNIVEIICANCGDITLKVLENEVIVKREDLPYEEIVNDLEYYYKHDFGIKPAMENLIQKWVKKKGV